MRCLQAGSLKAHPFTVALLNFMANSRQGETPNAYLKDIADPSLHAPTCSNHVSDSSSACRASRPRGTPL